MKNITFFFVAVIFLSLLGTYNVCAYEGKVIFYEDFEKNGVGSVPNGWAPTSANYVGNIRVEEEKSNNENGKKAVFMNAVGIENETAMLSTEIAVKANVNYTFSLRYKKAVSDANMNFKDILCWLNFKGEIIKYDNNWTGIANDNNWNNRSLTFSAPEGATKLILSMGISAYMAIYYDDIKVTESDARIFVDDIFIEKSTILLGNKGKVTLTLRNPTTQIDDGVNIKVTIKNSENLVEYNENRAIFLSPNTTKKVEITIPFSSEGAYIGNIEISSSSFKTEEIPLYFAVVKTNQVPENEAGFKSLETEDKITLQNSKTAIVFQKAYKRITGISIFAFDGAYKKLASLPMVSRIDYICDGIRCYVPVSPSKYKLENNVENINLILTESIKCENGLVLQFEGVFKLSKNSEFVRFEYKLTSNKDVEIVHFSGPLILAGEGAFGKDKKLAIFPGVEYLEKNQIAGGEADHFIKNFVPHTYSITIPAMNIVNNDFQIALLWDANQKWNGVDETPAAMFSSPDIFLGYQNSHSMGVFLPGGAKYTNINSLIANPYTLKHKDKMTLEGYILAEKMKSTEREYTYWNDVLDMPSLPKVSVTKDKLIERSMKGYLNLYDKAGKGWGEVINVQAPIRQQSDILNMIKARSHSLSDIDLKKELELISKEAINVISGVENAMGEPSLRFGLMKNYVDYLENWATAYQHSQREDGGFVWKANSKQQEAMGPDGSTAIGVVTRPLSFMLKYAYIVNDEKMLNECLKALKFTENMLIPSGGETWEVPVREPNLMGSTLAIEAFLNAYEITNDEEYLKSAKRWAFRALPFIYMWNAQDRDTMAYNTIPVIGGSAFYNGCNEYNRPSWRGKPVMWGGIEFAKALYRLNEYDNSFKWDNIYKGIINSTVLWQEKTAKIFPHLEGAFTDYFQMDNEAICSALIYPTLLLDGVSILENTSALPTFKRFKNAGRNNSIVCSEKITEIKKTDVGFSFLLNSLGNTEVYAIINVEKRPSEISCGSKILDYYGTNMIGEVALKNELMGWYYDTAKGIAYVKAAFGTNEIQIKY